MQNHRRTIYTGLLAATIALLVGCSSTPKTATVQLPDPQNVPKEKWSDAMHVLTAMNISGQRDVPLELATSGPTTATSGTCALGVRMQIKGRQKHPTLTD